MFSQTVSSNSRAAFGASQAKRSARRVASGKFVETPHTELSTDTPRHFSAARGLLIAAPVSVALWFGIVELCIALF